MPTSHPPVSIIAVLENVLGHVRRDPTLSAALDAYADPSVDNARIRWLGRREAFEVVLYFDAATIAGES